MSVANLNPVKYDLKMEIQKPWFNAIADPDISKRKTVEGRVGNLQKHIGLTGKNVKILSGDGEYMIVKVLYVTHYNTLDEYIQAEGWKNVAPHADSYIDTLEKYLQITTIDDKTKQMIKVFGSDRIAELGGINALHLKLLTPIAK